MRLRETPVPIPNTMVKPETADGTTLETAWESRWLPNPFGGIAQLGERLPCKQEVTSSILVISTWVILKNLYYLMRTEKYFGFQLLYLENCT